MEVISVIIIIKKTLFMHFLFHADVQLFYLSKIVQFDVMIFRNRVN